MTTYAEHSNGGALLVQSTPQPMHSASHIKPEGRRSEAQSKTHSPLQSPLQSLDFLSLRAVACALGDLQTA